MPDYIKICKLTDLPGKRGKKFQIDGETEIAVFKIDDKVYAVENTCPHNQSHVMDEGNVDENLYLACPIHGWRFHLETGKVPVNDEGFSGKLQVFNTKIENGEVWIEKRRKKFKMFDW
jgi:NAD(P)H-dependent nitrite reductase small subunit